jgi:diguanylate cyclase (GGDEF)-like protein
MTGHLDSKNLFITNENLNLSQILHNIGDAICLADKDMNLLGVNQRFADLYNLPADKLLGLNVFVIYPEFKNSVFYEAFQHTIKTGESATRVGYSSNLKKWIVSRSSKYDANRYVAISQVLHTGFNQAGYIQNYDGLTSLKNRFSFEADVSNLHSTATPFGLAIIDISRFRFLNETFGLEFGDKCLMEAAARIKASAGNFNQVYRINSDQFAMLMPKDKPSCIAELHKTINCFKQPFTIKSEDYVLDIKLGFFYNDMVGLQHLNPIAAVEDALLEAKKTKKTYVEYSNSNKPNNSKMILAKELKEAIKNNQLEVYYQAQVDSINDKICGAEALIRWNHPTKGLVAPFHFLPLAEEYDLMQDIDRKVLEYCFKDIIHFSKQNVSLPISINLSSDSISDIKTIDYVDALLARARINPSLVTIEITETSLINNIEVSKQVINHFKSIGFKIAIDDFGTGYSSISYIVRYPTDYLKIDRSFVTNIHSDVNLQNIVTNITKMAHSLNIAVVAEGVESIAEDQFIKNCGCDIIQGYYYSKPAPKSTLIELIKKMGVSNMKSSID